MKSKDQSVHITEALIRATEHMPAARVGESAQATLASMQFSAFTIALSREVGARGTTVARELNKRLQWPVYDHELLEHMANELKVDVHVLEHVDEKTGNWIESCVEALAAVPSISEMTYFRHLMRTLLTLGARGKCIIVGRGAPFALPAATTLRVRLFASLEDRTAFSRKSRGLSEVEAAKFVEKADRERIRFVKDHFQKDPTDQQHYDLLLNSSRFSASECADLIVNALHCLQAQKDRKLAGIEGKHEAAS